jgi:NAD-dependent dihydropyrimidine dehydrogenase PreA subunit
MKVKRKIVQIDEERCDGCGVCVPSCAEGAIQLIDGKARLVAEEYCDGLGACLGECPNDALQVIEREADEFDEEAVEHYLKAAEATAEGKGEGSAIPTMACGCPSAQIQSFVKEMSCEGANEPMVQGRAGGSALSHWPVQIRLVPATAPFLKGAELLVVADCTPLAYPNFHQDFLHGKVAMVGCPKFDETQMYVEKFAEIFEKAGIRSVTVLTMEVPCCQGLPVIVKRGMDAAGKKVPMEQVMISTRGEILKRQKMVA